MIHQPTESCTVCHAPLIKLDTEQDVSCSVCGKQMKSSITCENHHFVCPSCKYNNIVQEIIQYCLTSNSVNPISLAQELMKLPKVTIHGPMHHMIVPASLLTAYYNSTDEKPALPKALEEAHKRSQNIPGGACAAWGVCGAAVGTGIFMSIINEVSPLSTDAWKKAGQLAAQSADAISIQGGPRCCKRDSFLALEEAVKYANDTLHTNFPLEKITCSFYPFNKQCKRNDCSFFPDKE